MLLQNWLNLNFETTKKQPQPSGYPKNSKKPVRWGENNDSG